MTVALLPTVAVKYSAIVCRDLLSSSWVAVGCVKHREASRRIGILLKSLQAIEEIALHMRSFNLLRSRESLFVVLQASTFHSPSCMCELIFKSLLRCYLVLPVLSTELLCYCVISTSDDWKGNFTVLGFMLAVKLIADETLQCFI